jgi:hypothetical protein
MAMSSISVVGSSLALHSYRAPRVGLELDTPSNVGTSRQVPGRTPRSVSTSDDLREPLLSGNDHDPTLPTSNHHGEMDEEVGQAMIVSV